MITIKDEQGRVFEQRDGTVWRLYYAGRSFTRRFPPYVRRVQDVREYLVEDGEFGLLIDAEQVL